MWPSAKVSGTGAATGGTRAPFARRGHHEAKGGNRLVERIARVNRVRRPGGCRAARMGFDTFPATCDGQPVTVTAANGSGASFWLGDQHYLLTSIHATDGPGIEFAKDYGHRTGLQDTQIQCTATIEEPEGLITIDVTAVAVP